MRIKKLAGGGLPAFVSYVNVEQALPAYAGIGSSSASAESTSSSKSSSSSKSGSSSDIGLLNKEMQKILMENGLPSDVQYFLQKADVFGNSIDPLDPHSQERIYTKLLSMLPEIKQNKAEYDDAIKHAREKGTLDQVAVTKDGHIYVRDRETGKIDLKSPNSEIDEAKFERLTNGQLLQMRAYVPGHAMDKGGLTTLVASSISFADIEKSITDKIDKLGKSTMSQEGFVRKDSKNAELMKGYEQIIGQGEDGVYKVTSKTVSQNSQAKAFLNYLSKSLSRQERAVLMNRASENGTTVEEVLVDLLQGRLTDEQDMKISFDNQATKGATDNEGKPVKGGLESMESTPAVDFFRGLGQQTNLTMKNGSGTLNILGNVGSIAKEDGSSLGTTTLDQVARSNFAPGLDLRNATFGNSLIDMTKQNKIVVDSNYIVGMDLPIDQEAFQKGIIKPDFALLKKVSEVQKQLQGETDPNKINAAYERAGLPVLYSGVDQNGRPILSTNYYRFAAMEGYADKGILPKDVDFDETVERVEDENDQKSIIGILKSNDKTFTESRSGFLFWTSPELYKGTVFIPIRNNAVNYTAGAKHTAYQSSLMQLAEAQKNVQKQHNDLGITLNY